MKEYLKLPLKFGMFFDKQKIPTCSLLDSIYRNLHLLITSASGENKCDELYGASFWDNDYDIHLSNDSRREIITNGLKQQIARYEKRINDVTVEVNVKLSGTAYHGVEIQRRKVEITVKGKIIRSSEPFAFRTGFFIGPLTLD